MAAFPQPNIHIHSAPPVHRQFPHPGPFIRNSQQFQHPSFPVQYPPPSYFPIPAGWDPSVSLAHPYIYDPTQVKHRRRTTPEQLKILEDTFKTDPKPNAALRKQLSLQIGMTPRVLQVWFQNRRMKVKRLAQKCQTASRNRASAEPEHDQNSDATDPSTSPPAPPTPTDNHDSPCSPVASTPSRSGTPSTDGGARLAPPQPSDSVRRGSLPAALGSLAPDASSLNASSAFEGVPDPAAYRRRSMTSLQRLNDHPFGPHLAATNDLPPTHTIVPPTPPPFSPVRPSFPYHHHSPSTPAHPARIPQANRAASFHFLPAPQQLHAFHPHTAAQPYTFPPRPLPPPRPGPLPASDYSFGTPPTQNAAQEEIDVRPYIPRAGSGDFNVQAIAAAAAGVAVPRLFQANDDDTDTEYSNSRFGSIASDTSASASASASVSGASAWGDNDRRGSWTGHVTDMLSGLEVREGSKADESMWVDWAGSSTESLVYPDDPVYGAADALRGYSEQERYNAHQAQSAYEQQESHKYDAQERVYPDARNTRQHLPISQTSELAFALCGGGGSGGSGGSGSGSGGSKEAPSAGASGSAGGGEEVLEMHHALAGYAEHPSVVEEYALKPFVTPGADGAPYNMY